MTIPPQSCLRVPVVFGMAFVVELVSAPVWAAEVVSFSVDIFPILQNRSAVSNAGWIG